MAAPEDKLSPPLTDDQTKAIRDVARQESRKSLRDYRRQALIGFLILLAGVLGGFHVQQADNGKAQQAIVRSGQVVAIEGCNRTYDTQQNLRDTVTRLGAATKRNFNNGLITETQYKQSEAAYWQILNKINLPDCSTADDTLTASPGAAIKVPAAREP